MAKMRTIFEFMVICRWGYFCALNCVVNTCILPSWHTKQEFFEEARIEIRIGAIFQDSNGRGLDGVLW